MTEKKNITRAQALTNAIEWITDAAGGDVEMLQTVEVLSKMLAQVTKPRKAAVSKARKGNEALAQWVYEHVGDTVTTKDVVNLGNVNIMTTQKASAVLRVACELGLFTKGDGKKVAYAKVYPTE